jgi:light-regulated signal transduction histidine kinase (bacteriophytochrome)
MPVASSRGIQPQLIKYIMPILLKCINQYQCLFLTLILKVKCHGRGLGLSLSYDIVKALGGDLQVQSVEGEGSEFIILLPVTL